MRKVSEYEQHADECRKMAAKMKDPTHKRQLEEMADAWTMLARERRKQLQKQAYHMGDSGGGLQPVAAPRGDVRPLEQSATQRQRR